MTMNASKNHIDCPSCLRSNLTDMNFCMYCGNALKANVEEKRVTDLSLLKPCAKCGKTDNLSDDFCVFCGTQIIVPGSEQPQSSAFKKFTWELEKIESLDSQVQDKVVAAAATPSPVPVQTRSPKGRGGFSWTILLAFLGLGVGAIGAYFLGAEKLQRVYLQLTWPRDGLVVYVEPKEVSYSLLDSSGKVFTVGKSSREGSFSIQGMNPGRYVLKLSSPQYRSIVQKLDLEADRTTVLGYPKRIKLPPFKKQSSS